MLEEKSEYLQYIKAIILLSLVDIPDMLKTFTPKEFIELANNKEKENKSNELMPYESSIHPFSVKTYLRYVKYYTSIDFARFNDINYNFEKLNNISVPLFMRWGNNKELIRQNANDLVNLLKRKLNNEKIDINYIDGANHSYNGKEEDVAKEIYNFLKEIK
jgi:hypothetical protein